MTQNNDLNQNKSNQDEPLDLLKELLLWKSAKDIRADINELFYAYLETELADSKCERQSMLTTHASLIEFFTKISKFKDVNPYGKH